MLNLLGRTEHVSDAEASRKGPWPGPRRAPPPPPRNEELLCEVVAAKGRRSRRGGRTQDYQGRR
eukprot:4791914-Pyramimonas_sp.AAC.1